MDQLLLDTDCEQITILRDPAIGLFGFLAIHDTRRGPAFGGIRRQAYPSATAALADACRLAAHMTLKCAVHGIPGGGGKVVLWPQAGMDRPAVYRRLGDHVAALGGRFFTGPDVGTEPEDLAQVARSTDFVTRPDERGPGDIGAATAAGVAAGVVAAARRVGVPDLGDAHVTIAGLGGVGMVLAGHLAAAGARLTVADIVPERVAAAVAAFGGEAVAPERAHAVVCDVFAPCALGGIVSPETLPELGARAIAGSANNVLATPECGWELHRRGIVYAPDFVINSGGLVHGALFHLEGQAPPPERMAAIGTLLDEVFATAATADQPPEQVAAQRARELLDAAPRRIYVPPPHDRLA